MTLDQAKQVAARLLNWEHVPAAERTEMMELVEAGTFTYTDLGTTEEDLGSPLQMNLSWDVAAEMQAQWG